MEYISSSKYYQFIHNFSLSIKKKFKCKIRYFILNDRDIRGLEDMAGFKDLCTNRDLKPIIQVIHSGPASQIADFISSYNQYPELSILTFKSPYNQELIFFMVPIDMDFREKTGRWGKNLNT